MGITRQDDSETPSGIRNFPFGHHKPATVELIMRVQNLAIVKKNQERLSPGGDLHDRLISELPLKAL